MGLVRSSSGKLPVAVIIAAVLVLCLAAGALTYSKIGKKLSAGAPTEREEKPAQLSLWKLEEFVVNLADRSDDPHYLKVHIVLGVSREGKAKGGRSSEGGPDAEEAKARDAIISVLTRRRFNDLLLEQGKVKLKSELKSVLNDALEEAEVVNIYFTSFAMQ